MVRLDHLKFAELGTGEYRKAVAQLAERLVQANAAAEASAGNLELEAFAAPGEEDDSLGSLDKLGAMENSLPHMSEILAEVGEAIQDIAMAMQEATADMSSNPNPKTELANRLRVARGLAVKLAAPAVNVRSLGGDFASSLNEVDEGVRIIIERAPIEVSEAPASLEQFEGFFTAIREMVVQAEIGMGAVSQMINQIEPVEKMSRDLRKPLRTLREGLTLFVDGLSVMRGWLKLIDEVEPVLSAQQPLNPGPAKSRETEQ